MMPELWKAVFQTFKQYSVVLESSNTPCSWCTGLKRDNADKVSLHKSLFWDIHDKDEEQYVRQLLIVISKCQGGDVIQQCTSRQTSSNSKMKALKYTARVKTVLTSIRLITLMHAYFVLSDLQRDNQRLTQTPNQSQARLQSSPSYGVRSSLLPRPNGRVKLERLEKIERKNPWWWMANFNVRNLLTLRPLASNICKQMVPRWWIAA